jgi:hypothetical protein
MDKKELRDKLEQLGKSVKSSPREIVSRLCEEEKKRRNFPEIKTPRNAAAHVNIKVSHSLDTSVLQDYAIHE